jgi:hypothetical protein
MKELDIQFQQTYTAKVIFSVTHMVVIVSLPSEMAILEFLTPSETKKASV